MTSLTCASKPTDVRLRFELETGAVTAPFSFDPLICLNTSPKERHAVPRHCGVLPADFCRTYMLCLMGGFMADDHYM